MQGTDFELKMLISSRVFLSGLTLCFLHVFSHILLLTIILSRLVDPFECLKFLRNLASRICDAQIATWDNWHKADYGN